MKHSFLILSVLASFFTLAAKADLVQTVSIQADYFPNDQYAIGLDIDENHQISRVYFDQDGTNTFYSLDQLSTPTTIFEIAGINLVRMSILSHVGTDQATIELDYTQNYLTRSEGSMTVSVAYNAATAQYEVTDLRDNKIIHSVEVVTRYSFLRMPIGIAEIDTE
jgi:hypothetical protein